MRSEIVAPLFLLAALGAGCGGADSGSSGAASADATTLYVAHFQVDCVGVAPMKCLRVREAADAPWTLFYQGIEGFDYEPGYDYELRVRKVPVENPPADAPSVRYVLVEVVGKTPMSSDSGAGEGLLAGEWTLAAFAPSVLEGAEADPSEALALLASRDRAPSMTFAGGRVTGTSGCNQYNGSYALEGGHSLTFGPLATTRRACPPPLMALETLYLGALETVEGVYVRDGETLELYGPGETLLLTFSKKAAAAAGPQIGDWRLERFGETALAGAAPDELEAVKSLGADDESTPTLGLDAAGRASGFSGCNRYTGTYASDGAGALTFGPTAGTMRACAGPGMAIETLYLRTLGSVKRMSVEGDVLALAAGDGSPLLTFRRTVGAE